MVQATEIRMTGALGSDSLAPWIEHRARKLNLQGWLEQSSAHTARIVAVSYTHLTLPTIYSV